MTVADTDVLIDFLQGKGASRYVGEELAAGRLAATVISHFELLSGAGNARRRDSVQSLLDALPVLSLDRDAATRAAEIRRGLDQAGIGIGMADSLIAGIVLSLGARLLTRNRRHFERIVNLPLIDWRE
ncbi:MAG: type II toxin-antitoxin system VapC family toxin [Bryobacteraceae bacterium]